MRIQALTMRLVALIVLLTSASDYSAFDRFDPSVPTNSAGLEAIPHLVSKSATRASLSCVCQVLQNGPVDIAG
jgi:hypothetical protein